MSEVDPVSARLTDSDIVRNFHAALVAVYPFLRAVNALEDDTQPYDDFDDVAEALWDSLVVSTFRWKYGLSASPALPRYAFSGFPNAPTFVQVKSPEIACRFVSFLGDRSYGPELFNSVSGECADGTLISLPFTGVVEFALVGAVV